MQASAERTASSTVEVRLMRVCHPAEFREKCEDQLGLRPDGCPCKRKESVWLAHQERHLKNPDLSQAFSYLDSRRTAACNNTLSDAHICIKHVDFLLLALGSD
eukprot:3446417-Amphidinium_carterae.1